jgi:beta-phosphoglucomutase-like phosphatase (HAD superfamily)
MSRPLPLDRVTTLLCDADGTLFPSEEPAFAASVRVTQALAQRYGLPDAFSAEDLRRASTGRNFRSTATDLLAARGVRLATDELDDWVHREKTVVTDHLSRVLLSDPEVLQAAKTLADRYLLAVVSSSALSRLDASFIATGLDEWFPAARRFSAEDSLPEPVSKPDPAIYRYAVERLAVEPTAAVAIEDSASGVRSAVVAGIPTLGLVQFVPADEQAARRVDLEEAGAVAVAGSWSELVVWL